MNSAEDLLERGFQLAYFIFPERSQAVRILSGAVNKLKTQSGRESRRAYWRDKYLKRAITRITREEGDMLQWLIFYESDSYEKEQEASHQARPKDMVLRYVKCLVRMTSAMSSFHVSVGLQRLLHNYSTVETQQVYESITDRYLGSDEYRRAKSVLMNKLEDRFGAMLKTCRTQHGEMRFESCEQQALWIDLVDLCLKAFTPWSTLGACPVPANFAGPERKLPSGLSGEGAADQNRLETNRCHAFIDPACYGRLARALSLAAPSQKLDVPRFFMENSASQPHSGDSPQAPGLSAEERSAIIDNAASQAERRRKTIPSDLTVIVDGQERAQFAASATATRQFEISEGAELMEIWTTDAGEPLLLATHRIAHAASKGIDAAALRLAFNGGAELLVRILGSQESGDSPRKAIVSVSCLASAPAAARSAAWLRMAPGIALASAVFIALGWFLGTVAHRRDLKEQAAAVKPAGTIQPQPSSTPVEMAKSHEVSATYRLVSDDLATRGNSASETPSVVLPLQQVVIKLELPVASADASRTFHVALKPFLEDKAITAGNGLKAGRSSKGDAIVTFELPSTLLEANKDYVVDLRYQTDKGGLTEISSYTFHTVRARK